MLEMVYWGLMDDIATVYDEPDVYDKLSLTSLVPLAKSNFERAVVIGRDIFGRRNGVQGY